MSLTKKELAQFYANKPSSPNVVTVGGKVSFSKLPIGVRNKIKERLAQKDEVMNRALKEHKFGIVIDGKEVSTDNIKDFEISKPGEISKAGKEYLEKHRGEIEKPKEEPKPKMEELPKPKKYSEKELFDMNKSKQVDILKSLGASKIPTLEKDRVKMILELQK